jgi:C_GCAxxG_C_C family probable redox protein
MNRAEDAVSCFKEGFNCAQSVFSSYAPQFGLNRELALKIATSFGGGMARMGKTCGAATGAFMVIGLKFGRVRAQDEQIRDQNYGLVREFVKRFEARNGSIVCRELLDCDISTPEGLKLAQDNKLFENVCPRFIRDAAEIVAQILI